MSFFRVLTCLFLILFSITALAQASLQSPGDGDLFQADPCAAGTCTSPVPLIMEYSGPQAERIRVVFTRNEDGDKVTRSLCFFDPIEGISCSAPPNNFDTAVRLTEGTWTAIPQAIVNGVVRSGASATFTVEQLSLPPAGPVSLSRVTPLNAAARLQLRSASAGATEKYSDSDTVRIIGRNLDKATNPFLSAYISPIPPGEPTVTTASALPAGEWCLYEAEIVGAGTLAGGESYLDVKLPELPVTTPDLCTVPQRPEGSTFLADWRWVIRDRWIREERQHRLWAINSPRDVAWEDAPEFSVTKPSYPLVDGFGFANRGTDSSYNEFLSVFGNNAYVCVDCIPGVGCLCELPRIPDPLYHLMWYPIYKEAIDSTNGSCNGMAATSLLMARGELDTETFDPNVLHPAGFENISFDATYEDSNFCTPYCSPPKPTNLWANIRRNHGVQISREFLFEMLDTLGEGILDPDSGQLFVGVPNATKNRIEQNPQGYVTCFFEWGNGHCVTPYSVVGNQIRIYDNNFPEDDSKFIEIVDGDYNYPGRSNSPNSGNALVGFPISIWQQGRHLLGLSDATRLLNGNLVEFLMAIVVGDAEMEIVTEEGSLGFDSDGNRTDSIPGGLMSPLMGPSTIDQRNSPAILAMNEQAPLVRIHAKGESYVYQTQAGGQSLQLGSQSAKSGQEDEIQLEYADQRLAGFEFRPSRDADSISPQVGMAITEGERALFRFANVSVHGGQTVGFAGDREQHSVRFSNNTGATSRPIITLDRTAGDYARAVFGPIEVPDGASHELVLHEWPSVQSATSDLDLDNDGVVDSSVVITANSLPVPSGSGATADLSVEVLDSGSANDNSIEFTVQVDNNGPDASTGSTVLITAADAGTIQPWTDAVEFCEPQADSTLLCRLGNLDSGDRKTLSFLAQTNQGEIGVSAAVFTASWDPDASNDSRLVVLGSETRSGLQWWWFLLAIPIIILTAILVKRRS